MSRPRGIPPHLTLALFVFTSQLTLGGAFALRAHQIDDTLVDLDAGQNALARQQLGQRSAIVTLLVEGFVEQDHAGDVFLQALVSGEQQLAVLAAVVFVVLNADILQNKTVEKQAQQRFSTAPREPLHCISTYSETLATGGRGLVGGQNTLTGGNNLLGDAGQLLLNLLWWVVEVGAL